MLLFTHRQRAVMAELVSLLEEIGTRNRSASAGAEEVAHAQATVPVAAADISKADQVRDLAALRDENLISDEEFEAKRKEILGL